MNSQLRTGVILLVGVLIAALAASVAFANDDAPVRQSENDSGVVDVLSGGGFDVKPQGSVDGSLFEVPTDSFVVDGDLLLVYRFASEADARAAASRLQADGSGIDTVMVRWIAPPHFFLAGDTIILYLGERAAILDLLVAQFGSQVAGAS